MGQQAVLSGPDNLDVHKIKPAKSRIPALDGLRGIAILSVLFWHSIFDPNTNSKLLTVLASTKALSWTVKLGVLSWSGVDLFFVLSGFLIGGILLDAADSPNYYKTFYIRRAFRILPLYSVVIGLTYSVHLLSLFLPINSDRFQSTIPWVTYPTFTQNLWMAYTATWGAVWLAPTWSLAIEEQFYLTAPFIMRNITRRQLTAVLVSVVVGAPLLRSLLFFHVSHGAFAAYVLTPCRADALSLGILSALLVRNHRLWQVLTTRRSFIYVPMAGLFGVLGYLAYDEYRISSGLMVCLGYSVLALFYTSCLLVALWRTRISERILCNGALMRAGQVAYCAYLIHEAFVRMGQKAVAVFFNHWNISFPHADGAAILIGGLLGAGMALTVAGFSWRFFERPLLSRGQSYTY